MDSVAKDKRIKREIANSNERRRMQSINAGFQKLKRLLPVNDGEKISKANILQHAANYITSVERDRISLHEQNTLIRQILLDLKSGKLDIDSALASINSNPSSMLTVPLNLQVTMASGSSTPSSFPTPRTSPTTPTLASAPTATATTTKTAAISQALFRASSTATTETVAATVTETTTNTTNNINSKDSVDITTTKVTTKSTQRTPKVHRRSSTRNNTISKSQNSNTTNHNSNNFNTGNNIGDTFDGAGGVACGINNDSNPSIGSVAEIISDKIASPKNGMSTPGSTTKAAIALPLEVPYTSEIVIGSHLNHHHLHHHPTEAGSDMIGPRKLLKTGATATGAAIDPQDSLSKGNQTLDTICKAIMVIEGDRVYKTEKS